MSTEALFDDDFRRQLETLQLMARKLAAGGQFANKRSRKKGSGVAIADFRPYAPGDEVRHIDWNYYAASRELLLRLFEEEEDLHIYLLVDVSPSMYVADGARARHAARLAAALGWVALGNLDRISVASFDSRLNERIPPSRGRATVFRLLRFLEELRPGGASDIAAAMQDFVAQTRRRGMVVVISDFFDHEGLGRGLDILRYNRFEPVVVRVTDQRDRSPRVGGELELVDAEGGKTLRVRVTPRLLARYEEALARHEEQLSAWARKHGILRLDAPVQRDVRELILEVFRMGGFLR